MSQLIESTFEKVLSVAYDASLKGIPGFPSAKALAEKYLAEEGDPEKAIRALISAQLLKCGAVGFATGIGGVLALPVAMPADLVATYYVLVRMVAAVAHLRGYDLHDERVKTLVLVSLIGETAMDTLGRIGFGTATKAATQILQQLTVKISADLQRKVYIQLARKISTRSASKILRLAPIIGGVINATINWTSCRVIATTALALLEPKYIDT